MQLKRAVPMEVESLNDLARMLLSSAHEQATLFYFERDGNTIFSSLVILPGYYEFHALPVIIFATTSEEVTGRFLRHDLLSKLESEEVQIVEHFDEREASTGMVRFIPLIHLKEPPAFF